MDSQSLGNDAVESSRGDTSSESMHIATTSSFMIPSSSNWSIPLSTTSETISATSTSGVDFSSTTHDVSSFFPISSTVITNITTAQPIITTPVPVKIPKEGGNLAYFVGVPVGIIGIIILLLITTKIWKWYKRKKLLKQEFTPCYTYDQTENEVVDGVLYPSGSNSVDLLHVDASPPSSRTVVGDGDNDKAQLLNDQDDRQLDDFASIDTRRCESVVV